MSYIVIEDLRATTDRLAASVDRLAAATKRQDQWAEVVAALQAARLASELIEAVPACEQTSMLQGIYYRAIEAAHRLS